MTDHPNSGELIAEFQALPHPDKLMEVQQAALMNLADEMDTESQQRETVPGDSNAD